MSDEDLNMLIPGIKDGYEVISISPIIDRKSTRIV
jgi:hypothetical protein